MVRLFPNGEVPFSLIKKRSGIASRPLLFSLPLSSILSNRRRVYRHVFAIYFPWPVMELQGKAPKWGLTTIWLFAAPDSREGLGRGEGLCEQGRTQRARPCLHCLVTTLFDKRLVRRLAACGFIPDAVAVGFLEQQAADHEGDSGHDHGVIESGINIAGFRHD